VASFFVSRVDTEIDARLDQIVTPEAAALRGRAAIANARLAYQHNEQVLSGQRWRSLAGARGATAVPLVGFHRSEESRLCGHPLRGGPGRLRCGQHDARSHASRRRRSP
jgi:hypothetical protein